MDDVNKHFEADEAGLTLLEELRFAAASVLASRSTSTYAIARSERFSDAAS